MTRASLFIFLDGRIIKSTEFNGDGYPEGHGLTYMRILELTKNPKDFIYLLERFNNETFRYEEKLTYKVPSKVFNYEVAGNKVIDLNNGYFDYFFSDWIFIKNLSSKIIPYFPRIDSDEKKIKTIDKRLSFITPQEQIALNFGYKDGCFTSVEDGMKTHNIMLAHCVDKTWKKIFGEDDYFCNKLKEESVHL